MLHITDISKSFGAQAVLDHASLHVRPGMRLGLVGPNGAGKTTLLRLICGSLKPSQGRVRIGASVQFGFLSQLLDELEPFEQQPVREVLKQRKSGYIIDGKELSPAQLLERMGFSREHLNSRVCDLSGGQRRRLQLLLTLLAEPNVLILDEPGNDMDTEMLAVMEELLDSWPGTLIVVSHDRYLMERVTDDQFALLDGRLRHVPGGVDEYLQLAAAAADRPGGAVGMGALPTPAAARLGANAHTLRKQLAGIERRLQTLRRKQQDLAQQMAAADAADYQALIALGEQQQQLKQQTTELEDAWLETSEHLEGQLKIEN